MVSSYLSLAYDARLFQQILIYFRAFYHSLLIKVNVYIFSKSTRVIVAYGLCISKSYTRQKSVAQRVRKLVSFQAKRPSVLFHGKLFALLLFIDKLKSHYTCLRG